MRVYPYVHARTVDCDSKVDVSLPASMRAFPGSPQTLDQPVAVLAETSPVERDRISRVLERAGMEVLAFDDGEDALAAIREGAPDLVLAGVIMRRTDGLTLVHELRRARATRDVPFILLVTSPHHTTAGFDLGADDCVSLDAPDAEIAARAKARLDRPTRAATTDPDPASGLVSERVLRDEMRRDALRAADGMPGGVIAVLTVSERESLRGRMGARGERQVMADIARLAGMNASPRDLVAVDSHGHVLVLAPASNETDAVARLERLARLVAAHTFRLGSQVLRLTPAIGYTTITGTTDPANHLSEATLALGHAASRMDLVPARFEPAMQGTREPQSLAVRITSTARSLPRRIGTPAQFLLTGAIGLGLPALLYWLLDRFLVDVTGPMYLAVVVILLATGALITGEGLLAFRKTVLPGVEPTEYPAASAIIAAYLPNEAATILDTVHAFQRADYPGRLQVIVAFNTPVRLPIQDDLEALARKDPRILLLEVEGSTSKAQNVNAALARVTGEFVGIFDADHHPQPGSFQRAWRWLANGYDVVQGHPVVRNGDTTLVGRTVAVEFEAIYSVAHPGRARMHGFGLFGGSNGFWRSDALRQVRMRPTMLTEDIDASLRAVLRGYRIGVDPGLVSTELAPVSLKALWHQRMRWAQGWTQCSLQHLRPALRSKNLSRRQKVAMIHLLGWREVYPWVSLQVIPIIGYWSWRVGGPQHLDWFVPAFVATSVVTLAVGPVQALFAYRLADPAVRVHRGWFALYLVTSTLAYTEMKNTIARIAHVREALRLRQWKVTPRGVSAPADETPRIAA